MNEREIEENGKTTKLFYEFLKLLLIQCPYKQIVVNPTNLQTILPKYFMIDIYRSDITLYQSITFSIIFYESIPLKILYYL